MQGSKSASLSSKKPVINRKNMFWAHLKRDAGLYLLLAPAVIYALIFLYRPMVGVLIAFEDYKPTKGIFGSTWVGLKWFNKFLTNYNFSTIFFNTLILSLYTLLASFPIPIIFALLLNQMRFRRVKKLVQTVSYMPHFISVVVLVGMMNVFLSPSNGLVNVIIKMMGRPGGVLHGGGQPVPACVRMDGRMAGHGPHRHHLHCCPDRH